MSDATCNKVTFLKNKRWHPRPGSRTLHAALNLNMILVFFSTVKLQYMYEYVPCYKIKIGQINSIHEFISKNRHQLLAARTTFMKELYGKQRVNLQYDFI
jgi:hypothetical protein